MDYLPLDLKCPNCGSPEAHFIVTLTDPDIDYARILIYECKCGRYLLLKRGVDAFIEDWEDLETCLDVAREDLLMEVRSLSYDRSNEENLRKVKRLTKLLSVCFEMTFDAINTLEDENETVRLLPLGDWIRVEIYKKMAYCQSPCIRNCVDLVQGRTYKIGNRSVFVTYYVSGNLEEIKILWFNVDENDSICIREILKHTFS